MNWRTRFTNFKRAKGINVEKRRKIVLVNPPTTPSHSKEVYFPLGLLCLASSLSDCGLETEIIDFDLELKKGINTQWYKFRDYALDRLERTEAEIFGISSICSNFPVSLLLAQEIRNKWPASKIILGGPQPSSVPEETLRIAPSIDVIVVGEGERTLADLLQCDWEIDSLRTISGIAFRDGEKHIVRTKGRELIDDLDSLPIPDYSFVPLKEYLNICPAISLIEAGRGCPFLCSFCSTALMWERAYRVKSPERILREMNVLESNHGLNGFGLTHDNFTTSHSHVGNFCDFFETNNQDRFLWSVSARPDTLNLDRLRALRKAGCQGLFFGIDTGSVNIQKKIRKNLDLRHCVEMLSAAVSLGMDVTASFILGFPQENRDDLNQTILLALKSKLKGATIVQFHPLAPLAATAIYEENKSVMEWRPNEVDLSLFSITGPEIQNLIAKSPDLFSFFYSLPTPNIGRINVPALAVFFDQLVNQMAAILEKILRMTSWTPVNLFDCWMDWREDHYPHRVIDGSLIFETFGQFIQEIPQRIIRTPFSMYPERPPENSRGFE